jgi:hypothetical protein
MDVMFTKNRQLGTERPLLLFESALIKVSQKVGRLLPEVKGGQMNLMAEGDLSWMVVCTLRGSYVADMEEIEIEIFDRTWEEGLLRVMEAALARLGHAIDGAPMCQLWHHHGIPSYLICQ